MARQRKPTSAHVLEGTFRKDRHGDRGDEPKPPAGAAMPSYLRKVAGGAKRWGELHAQLTESKVLTVIDAGGLARLCVLQLDFEAWAVVGARRDAFPSAQLAELRQLETAFGMNPAGRAKVKVTEKAPPANPLSRWRKNA